jgi:FkbM family methyltransferase
MNYDNWLKKLDNRPLILFGASTCGKKAVDYLLDLGVKIDYFCDNDYAKWGKKIMNIEVISPKQLCEIEGEVNILVTSSYFEEIAGELRTLGFKYIYNYDYSIAENQNKIQNLFNILSDAKSKEVLKNIINYRITRNIEYIREIAEYNQYFPDDIITFDENEVIIDGGAFNGYTLLSFIMKMKDSFKKCFSFEPDAKNYYKLNKFVQNIGFENAHIFNKGLFNRDGTVKFTSQEAGSRINSDDGEEEIEVIKLDNFLENEKVTFIKMDIEGAELEALDGAKNIINNNRPKLAICIYHKPTDLWEIPLYLNSLNLDYKIYIRHHNFLKPYETVCYAVK